MESLFRMLKGYLVIRVSKQGLVRFLNLCTFYDISVWNIIEKEAFVQMNIKLHDFKKIKIAVQKSKVRIKILKKIGFPFFMIKLRGYTILCAGIVLCLLFLYYQKIHLWTIRTEGNISVTKEQIEDCLIDNGIYSGMPAKMFSPSNTEKVLKECFDSFSWVCTFLDGTEIVVSVIENSVSENETKQEEFPSSLYATKDGLISKLIVNKGVSVLKPGEEIHAGDLLISGEVPYDNNDGTKSFYLTYAQGEYLCEVKIPYSQTLSFKQPDISYGSWQKSLAHIQICNGKIFPLFSHKKNTNTIIFREYYDLNFLSIFDLNQNLIFSQTKNFQKDTCIYTQEEVKTQLTQNLNYYLKELEENGAQNISPKVSFHINADSITLSGHIIYFDSETERKYISPQTDRRMEYGNGYTDNGT